MTINGQKKIFISIKVIPPVTNSLFKQGTKMRRCKQSCRSQVKKLDCNIYSTRHEFLACSTQHRGKKFENTVVGVEASATLMLLFLLESKFSGPRCISVGFSVDLRGFLGGSPCITVDLRGAWSYQYYL